MSLIFVCMLVLFYPTCRGWDILVPSASLVVSLASDNVNISNPYFDITPQGQVVFAYWTTNGTGVFLISGVEDLSSWTLMGFPNFTLIGDVKPFVFPNVGGTNGLLAFQAVNDPYLYGCENIATNCFSSYWNSINLPLVVITDLNYVRNPSSLWASEFTVDFASSVISYFNTSTVSDLEQWVTPGLAIPLTVDTENPENSVPMFISAASVLAVWLVPSGDLRYTDIWTLNISTIPNSNSTMGFSVAVDNSEKYCVAWLRNDGTIFVSVSNNSFFGWATPTIIANDINASGPPSISWSNGVWVVAWTSASSQLRLFYSVDGNTWNKVSNPQPITGNPLLKPWKQGHLMLWVGPKQSSTGSKVVYAQELVFDNTAVTTCSAKYGNSSTDCNSDGIPDQCEYLNSTTCSPYVPVVNASNTAVVSFPNLNPDFLIQPTSPDGSTASSQYVFAQFPAWYEIDSSGDIVQEYNMSNDYNLLKISELAYTGIYFQPKDWTKNVYIEWLVVIFSKDGQFSNDTTIYQKGTVKWSITVLLAAPLAVGHRLKFDWLLTSGAGPISLVDLTAATNGSSAYILAKSSGLEIQISIDAQALTDGQGYDPVTFQLQQLPFGDLGISITLPPFNLSLELDPSVNVLLSVNNGGTGVPVLAVVLPIVLGVPFVMAVIAALVAVPIFVTKAMSRQRRMEHLREHVTRL